MKSRKETNKEGSHLDFSQSAFESIDYDGDGFINKQDFFDSLLHHGILASDPRLKETVKNLKLFKSREKLSLAQLRRALRSNTTIIERALKGLLVVPNFAAFRQKALEIFKDVAKNKSGSVASYIPELSKVKPEQFGMSIVTIDGQRFDYGDFQVPYSIQSTCKPINYALALEEHGVEKVHKHIGREQSGVGFNAITLSPDGLPHNPMINAGAIMACSLVKAGEPLARRLAYVMEKWTELSGGLKAKFDKATYNSEKGTADRNFALGYFMREHHAFPSGTNLMDTLDLYFQACSIQLTTEQQAVAAGTLANGGICPTNGKRVLKSETVKHVLSMMYSSGMYDFSGEFAFWIGLPAKSGVAGTVVLVVPNVMGIVLWSPRLDAIGNSVRGIEFSQKLVKLFNFHVYDSLSSDSQKIDPRLQDNESKISGIMAATDAASRGDLTELERLVSKGVDLNGSDYDLRTPVHLAASEGQEEVLKYLIARKVNLSPRDRWGGTPLGDAQREGRTNLAALLKKHGAK
jgi:glutaminase